jgi:glycosyltransferase involved in cell wall biosynthesis
MKILHIIPNIAAKRGGTAYAVMNILVLEKSIGIESTVISINSDGVDAELFESVKLVVLKPSFPKRFSFSRSVSQWLEKNAHNYDIVAIHTIWGGLQIKAAQILYRLNIPFIIWPHGSLDPFDLQKKHCLKKLLGPVMIRSMLDKSKAVICTAKREAEKIEMYGSKTAPAVLPLPVSPSGKNGNRNRFRRKQYLGDNDFVLLFLSLLYYKKGLGILIPAMKKLSIDYPNVKLVIAGSDLNGYEKKVRGWIQKYRLEDNIIMTGFLSGQDKYDAFAGSDCFVLPSMNENFGIAVVEALNASLPVLISRNVYIWEEIIEGGGGWVCDYSVESLTESIRSILENPSDLKIKKDRTVYSARQFSPENLKPLYKNFYEELIC